MKKFIYFIIVIAVAAIAWYCLVSYQKPVAQAPGQQEVAPHGAIEALYVCAGGKSVDAFYSEGVANVTLSDGRKMELDTVEAASGAKYANAAGTVIFWEKSGTAFVQEGEAITYKDCVKASPELQ